MVWILFTLGAVSFQTVRNAIQSKLSESVHPLGVTLARFLFAPPIAGLYLLVLYFLDDQPIPQFNYPFFIYVVLAAALQIIATFLMVVLFKQRNFAIGAGLAKSEALVAGVVGAVFFGSSLSFMGWLGILIGGIAVFVLSSTVGQSRLSLRTVAIGLACGSSFALTSLFVREASSQLNLPASISAAWVLLLVLILQTMYLITYLYIVRRKTFSELKRNITLTASASFSSCLGSICWFTAMALQHVAYVKTLGQVEVLLTLLLAHFGLKNKVKSHEILGMFLIAIAAVMVMWAAI